MARGERALRWMKKPPSLRSTLRFLLALSVMGMVAWTSLFLYRHLGQLVEDLSLQMGLKLERVFVVGRRHLSRDVLKKTLGVTLGEPILFINLSKIRHRLEALGWVRSAIVERRLPHTLIIHIQEKKPVALWHKEKNDVLIDRSGHVIGHADTPSPLLRLVGKEAPQRWADLQKLWKRIPTLQGQITQATWTRNKRWTLHLRSGSQLILPAKHPVEALQKLITFLLLAPALEKGAIAFDLRQPDRILLRVGKGAT